MSCGKCEEKEETGGKEIGEIDHYFSKIGVGIVKLSSPIKVGDKIKIKGHTTDIEQTIDSIQVDHKEVQEAKPGECVGIKVPDKVRDDDKVYLAE